ncbi:uncharacterized protein LOC116611114 isoform X2 [Nematostella vectensis]|uniref:uncharacterized protein LOC116611114 isoform X2 n=1 Tax=Nematostella vectensis TaxID=45351 RepID=UPI00207730CB|nr:uncharacterized protein LOC116611114 isoform X2 [Nematostella vectensis]
MNTSSWDGKVLSLQCKARGLPSPQITWYKPSGQPITAGVIPISGGQLQLTTTQDSGDYGQYMCQASDLLWSVERLIDLTAISIRGTNLIPFLTSAKYKFCSGLNYFDLIRLALDLIGCKFNVLCTWQTSYMLLLCTGPPTSQPTNQASNATVAKDTTPYPSTALGGRALVGVILACVVIVAIDLV